MLREKEEKKTDTTAEVDHARNFPAFSNIFALRRMPVDPNRTEPDQTEPDRPKPTPQLMSKKNRGGKVQLARDKRKKRRT